MLLSNRHTHERKPSRPASLALGSAAWSWLVLAVSVVRADEPPPRFEQDVLPILTQHCLKCHGLEARKGSLDLRTMGLTLRGGENGPVLVKGNAKESPLFARVADQSMPPEGELRLTEQKIETLRRWIETGAAADETSEATAGPSAPEIAPADREFWSFQKLHSPAVPAVRDPTRVRTPIDTFLLARLEHKGLSFSPEADRRTLVRRAYFDLIGLPPTPAEVAGCLADASPDWYEQLVNRLLDSPHFGERWGRHWLDAAGYVDTVGADNDAAIILPADGKWRYRDYVVGSFNKDKPYDRFLTEQLAGDELADWRTADTYSPEMLELLVATGYLRNVADRSAEDELNTADIRYSVLYDTMELIGTNLLGLTMQCARCHTHKYEPLPHADYYRLMSLFTPSYNPQAWLQPHRRDGTSLKPQYRELPDISPAEQKVIDDHNAGVQRQVDALAGELATLRSACQQRLFAQKLAAVPEQVRADTQAALETPADKRNEVQKYLVEKLGPTLAVSPDEVTAALNDAERKQAAELQARIDGLNATRRSYGKIQALYDVGPAPVNFILRRGDYQSPGLPVEPGFPAVLCDPGQPVELPVASPEASSSGRRLALARWLTDAQSPSGALVSRVMVNRIWSHLFGRGIVQTTGNFGRSGSPPTHPELLEWLAGEFVAGGWHVKPLIRLIMESAAYRQSSHDGSDAALAADPNNDLLWKMRLRRLESEIVRDSILAVGGNMNPSLGGPPLMLDPRPDGSVVLKTDGLPAPSAAWRRSLYILARRAYHLSMLDVFDQPVVATNCTDRSQSAVVTQSLALLNDPFLFEQASHFARRVAAGAESDADRVRLAFEIAVSRPPESDEILWSLELLQRQEQRFRAAASPNAQPRQKALEQLCHMLFNANEFLYVQ